MKVDWRDIASALAPTIAGALSGGNPVVIGLTSSIIKKALGLPPEATAENITNTMATDPDAIIKIKQAEIDLQAKLAEYGIQDVASARQMQEQTRDKTPMYLTILTVALFMVMLWFVCYKDIPQSTHDTFILLLGLLVACVKDVYGFYFGSSQGSRHKDDTIQNMSK